MQRTGVTKVAIFKYLSYEISLVQCVLYFYGFKQVQVAEGELWISMILCIYGYGFGN